jgi:hypothetical protein
MTRAWWKAYAVVAVPGLAGVGLTQGVAYYADPEGVGWGHFLTLLAAQLVVVAIITPAVVYFWRKS